MARKYTPDALVFGKIVPRWVPLRRKIEGEERARLLRAVRNAEALPDGLVVGASFGPSFAAGPIPLEEIEWEEVRAGTPTTERGETG